MWNVGWKFQRYTLHKKHKHCNIKFGDNEMRFTTKRLILNPKKMWVAPNKKNHLICQYASSLFNSTLTMVSYQSGKSKNNLSCIPEHNKINQISLKQMFNPNSILTSLSHCLVDSFEIFITSLGKTLKSSSYVPQTRHAFLLPTIRWNQRWWNQE